MDSDYGNMGSARKPGKREFSAGKAATPNHPSNGGDERIALYASRLERGLDIFTGEQRGWTPQEYLSDDELI
jgi:hypothetical protein